MNRIKLFGATAIVAFAFAASADAATHPMVGGAAMYATKNIIENAMNSKDHTTLVAAVWAGGLVNTLEGSGPFTVFAPTNEAFAALPPGTVKRLEAREHGNARQILTYHVVPGQLNSKALDQQIMSGGGKAVLKTWHAPLRHHRSIGGIQAKKKCHLS